MSRARFLLCLMAGLTFGNSGAQAPRRPTPHVYQEISACEPGVPIPPAVVKVLLRRTEGERALTYLRQSKTHSPAELWQAATIHLADDEDDLVVCGVNIFTTGGDNNWRWIVVDANTQPKVVLWEGSGELALLQKKTNGYRDILSRWRSPSEEVTKIYRYDGTRYRKATERWTKPKF